jgi:hypothetical protein
MDDGSFADSLFTYADKALRGFGLTVDELVSLKTLSQTELKKTAKATSEER